MVTMGKMWDVLRATFVPGWEYQNSHSEDRESPENSLFRKFVDGKLPVDSELFRNEKVICFHDKFPSAPVHILVIPKEPIRSVFSLRCDDHDRALIQHMVEIAVEQMKIIGAPGDPTDWRIGFHVPPHTSVNHLHLHAVSGELNLVGRLKFHKFLPVEVLLETLKEGEPGPAKTGFKAHMIKYVEARSPTKTSGS